MPLSEMYLRGLAIAVVVTAAGLTYSATARKAPHRLAPRPGDGIPQTRGIVLGRRTVPIACARGAGHDGQAAESREARCVPSSMERLISH